MNRRQFLRSGLLATAAATSGDRVRAFGFGTNPAAPSVLQNRICLFTDHLQGYDVGDVAKQLEQLKVAGPDLTVRPGGLVRPEAVEIELPKAVVAFRDRGLSVPMITTALTSAEDPAARAMLSTMGRLGIRYYKVGYFPFGDPAAWESRLAETRRALEGLIKLGRAAGVTAGFHNHSGATVGGALWDAWEILRPLDRDRIGFYFDPSHATIEGGNHAWKLSFARAAPRIVMIAIKDFVWEKSGGEWRSRWCPLGEGMVRWGEFFRMLAGVAFPGPVSLHIEYEVGGRSRLERFDNSLAAAQRDLEFLRKHLDEASVAAEGKPNGD